VVEVPWWATSARRFVRRGRRSDKPPHPGPRPPARGSAWRRSVTPPDSPRTRWASGRWPTTRVAATASHTRVVARQDGRPECLTVVACPSMPSPGSGIDALRSPLRAWNAKKVFGSPVATEAARRPISDSEGQFAATGGHRPTFQSRYWTLRKGGSLGNVALRINGPMLHAQACSPGA
jgi:hypothetical protein